VLINLTSNAVKFTDEGSVELSSEEAENMLLFKIKDTGIGIPDEDLNVIFEEFRQVDGALNRKYKGTGLGLAICRRYSNLLGGKITIESSPGNGSLFSFYLPFVKGESLPQPPANMYHSDQPVQDIKHGHEKRITVVTGNITARNIIGEYLRGRGYAINNLFPQESTAGQLKKTIQEAVILDASSLSERAWLILKEIKSDEMTRKIPVIVFGMNQKAGSAYGIPAFDYCMKKETVSEIIMAEELLKKKISLILVAGKMSEEFRSLDELSAVGERNVVYVTGDEDFMSYAETHAVDIIIADLNGEDENAVSLLYRLRQLAAARYIPVIITLDQNFSEKESANASSSLNSVIEAARNNPIDILKTIKDRLLLQEGILEEDSSSVWIEPGRKISEKIKATVLVVDDDNDTLFTVGEIIRKAGYEIIYAKNGYECLSTLQSFKPDLVLLDIMMPKMDGFETIRNIRKDDSMKNLKVFAMTAQAMIDDRRVIMNNGFDDFIPKPVNPESLIFKISNAVV
jgi:CheY-like chemotaxis protein